MSNNNAVQIYECMRKSFMTAVYIIVVNILFSDRSSDTNAKIIISHGWKECELNEGNNERASGEQKETIFSAPKMA